MLSFLPMMLFAQFFLVVKETVTIADEQNKDLNYVSRFTSQWKKTIH